MTLDFSSVYNGYLKSTGNAGGLDRRTLKRALSPYNLAMPGSKQTDSQLRALAVKSVLARYRKEKTLL